MTVIKIDVEGETKELYVDNNLYNQVNTYVKPRVEKKDNDCVYIVDGPEGSGKSVFSMQLAKLFDPDFDISRCCFTPTEFTKAVIKAKKGQCVVFDEAFTGLSSRAALSEVNKLIVSLMMEMRQKNLFVIIVMPTFFLLDRYVALFRARGLFHVYMKKGKRGNWIFFNQHKKKLLYILGKKLFDYSNPRSTFKGHFFDRYTINETEYRKKKGEALNKKSRLTRAEGYKNQRDILFYILNRKFKILQKDIVEMCKEEGYNLDRALISEICIKHEQDKIKKEAINEIEQETKAKI